MEKARKRFQGTDIEQLLARNAAMLPSQSRYSGPTLPAAGHRRLRQSRSHWAGQYLAPRLPPIGTLLWRQPQTNRIDATSEVGERRSNCSYRSSVR